MKNRAMLLLIITTLVLVTLVILSVYNAPFAWVFYLMVAGQLLFIYTVYRVLTDDYTTNKTFDDFYEDHPISKEDQ